MKKIIYLLIIILPLWILFYWYSTVKNLEKVELYTSQIVSKNNMNSEKYPNKWKYYNGVLMYALLQTGQYDKFVNLFYDEAINDDYSIGELDSIAPARTLFYLDSKKYKEKLDFVYQELLKQETLSDCANNYKHKMNNPRWEKYPLSLDGLYMALPFVMEYSKMYNLHEEKAIFERLNFISNNLKLKNNLYTHGISSDGKTTNGIVWLRACGWYAMAQVDIIELMPESKEKEILKKQLILFFDAMLKYQHSGMWKNVIFPKNNLKCNKYETSGSLMLSYAMMKSYTLGFVKNPKYAIEGVKIFNKVVSKNLKKDKNGIYNLKDIYKSSSVYDVLEEYCVCEKYIENDAKGIAPLILSSLYVRPSLNKLTNVNNLSFKKAIFNK